MRSILLAATLPLLVASVLLVVSCFQPCSAAALGKRGDRDSNGIDLSLRLGPPSPPRSSFQTSTLSPINAPTTPLRGEPSPLQAPVSPYQQSDANVFQPGKAKYRGSVYSFQQAIQDGAFLRAPREPAQPPQRDARASTSANPASAGGQESRLPVTQSGRAIQEANEPTRQHLAPAVFDTGAPRQTSDVTRQALAPRPVVAKPRKSNPKGKWLLVTSDGHMTANTKGQYFRTPAELDGDAANAAKEGARAQALAQFSYYSAGDLNRPLPLLMYDKIFILEQAVKLQERINQVSLALSVMLKHDQSALTPDDRNLLNTPFKDWESIVRELHQAYAGTPITAKPALVESVRQDTELLQRLESLLRKVKVATKL
ncbi:conserved hypothetical protein [Sporisorium reilianum SRZ2]|uniref:Uncharacterized protein n=1 Tax=Sporisorium reilianum (strain SRZ2) TaxID=999809 RepID=E6ZN57_SPORE|nr:conserved hypothetical protein [Sporisorium reilianum SRZ2]